jgi:hypothetical protein
MRQMLGQLRTRISEAMRPLNMSEEAQNIDFAERLIEPQTLEEFFSRAYKMHFDAQEAVRRGIRSIFDGGVVGLELGGGSGDVGALRRSREEEITALVRQLLEVEPRFPLTKDSQWKNCLPGWLLEFVRNELPQHRIPDGRPLSEFVVREQQ